MNVPDDEARFRRLLEVGRTLVAELDTESVLRRILEEARTITGARYAALGVLNDRRTELDRFITAGLDMESARNEIGELPRGRGVLGVLIEEPRPLRLSDVGQHPQSYGFPPGHPPMGSFLGVPVVIRGQAWGNLYLTEKQGGVEFTQEDEDSAVLLSEWAGIAIENARLYESSERRRTELERAVRSLEAARHITQAIGNVEDLHQVLELIAKRGRALVEAQTLLIMLREDTELYVAASAGQTSGAEGRRLPLAGSTSGEVLARGRPERISNAAAQLRVAPEELGVSGVHAALLVPMIHRGTGVGLLAAFDRAGDRFAFSAADEQLLQTFAQAAANAVALNRSVESARLRSALAAADAERRRWARELHDQTLQALGGLRVLLSSAQRRKPAFAEDDTIRQAIEDIDLEITNLRSIIADLRPSLLDDLGLQPALEALLTRRREAGLEITGELALPGPDAGDRQLPAEIETTVYRLVQEALTNIVKHAGAARVRVSVALDEHHVLVEVQDDGAGFDTQATTAGFGLAGMRERVLLGGGTLDVDSGAGGTTVRARLPASLAGPEASFVRKQVAL